MHVLRASYVEIEIQALQVCQRLPKPDIFNPPCYIGTSMATSLAGALNIGSALNST